MDEGSALLHHLERKVNSLLSLVVNSGGVAGAIHSSHNTKVYWLTTGFLSRMRHFLHGPYHYALEDSWAVNKYNSDQDGPFIWKPNFL